MLLQTSSIANWLENKLNVISQNQEIQYKFKIFGDVGDNKPSDEIKGVVKCVTGNTEPLKNDIDIEYIYVCELAVASQNANYDIINVRALIDSLIEQENATSDTIDGGDCLFTFSTALPKDYKIEYGVGTITPIYFTIYVRYTQNAITSANKHWFLDEFEIPFLTENVSLDKDGMLNKINGENYSKVLLTGQTKFYKFTFQYDTKNNLCIGLQKDILNGNFEKTYTLKYYDGVAYTEAEPFTTTVSIYKNGDSGVERTKTGIFNITFVDADSGNTNTKYYLALIDTPFDLGGDNTRNFLPTETQTAKEVQIAYYESKIANGGANYEQIKAPNLNSIDITSQVYRNTNNYDLFDLVNKNYAIIKIENGTSTKYYYYFVTNATIGAGNQVVYDLKLDTLQTYFFEDNINFADCIIEKAHLNRFANDVDDNTKVVFNATRSSQLFEDEEFGEAPKILTKRTKINLKVTDNDTINNFLNENVAYWVYISLDKYQEEYNVFSTTADYSDILEANEKFDGDNAQLAYYTNGSRYVNETAILFFPVMKTDKSIYVRKYSNNRQVKIDALGFDFFRTYNKNTSYLYNVKFSIYPPANLLKNLTSENYEIDENGNFIIIGSTVDASSSFITLNSDYTKAIITFGFQNDNITTILGLFAGLTQDEQYLETENYEIVTPLKFDKSDIVGANKNYEYNPKMLSSNFRTVTICDSAGGKFEYDLQKLNMEEFNFLYTEPIHAEITKYYFRVNAKTTMPLVDNGSLYNEDMNNNYFGLVGSIDNSVALSNDQYSQFLANNKNFWLQSNFKIIESAGMGAFSGAIGGQMATTKGALGAVVGTIAGAVTSTVDRNLTVDNMKNAPSSLTNANGSAIFNMFVTEMGLYIEEYNALSNEKEMANDIMFKNGFTVNRLGNIKDYTNIRKYFNYVRAQLDAISGVSMSNTARADLTSRFANGVRFWNDDNIQYDLENYENWLED